MDFSVLKQKFAIYLESKNDPSSGTKKYETDTADFNIFRYANEFKEFISDNYQTDAPIQSMSINQILDMEMEGGKLVDPEKIKDYEDALNSDDTLYGISDEAPADSNISVPPADGEAAPAEGAEVPAPPATGEALPAEGAEVPAEGEEAEMSVTDFLNGLLEDENFVSLLDNNSDKTIDKDELRNYLESVKGLDGNEDDLSVDDLVQSIENLLNNTLVAPELKEEDLNDMGLTDEEKQTYLDDRAAERAAGSSPGSVANGQPTSSAGGSSGGGNVGSSGGGGGVSNAGSSQPQEKTLSNMSKEELQSELTKAEGELSTKQSELSAIQDGSNSELQGMQENIDKLYDDYQEQLKEVDEELAQRVDENKQAIDEKKSQINEIDQNITQQESAVSEAETALDNAKARVETYNAALSELEGTDTSSMSDEQKAAISSKISGIKAKISEAEAAETAAQEKLDEAKAKLQELQDQKTEEEGKLQELETAKADLDAEVQEKYPEVAKLLDEYNKAQTEFDTKKQELTTEAQKAVDEAQNYVNEVNTAIESLETAETAAEYSPDEYNSAAGNKILDYVKSHLRGTRGKCLAGVSDAIEAIYGKRLGLYAADAADKLAGTEAGYEDVASHFKEIEVPRDQLTSLPEGCIVVWERNNSSAGAAVAGHIVITDGQGGGYSDHQESPMYYVNSNVGYRVFVPTS